MRRRPGDAETIFSLNVMSALVAILKRQDYFVTVRVADVLKTLAQDGMPYPALLILVGQIHTKFGLADSRKLIIQCRAIPVLVKCLEKDPCNCVVDALVKFGEHGKRIPISYAYFSRID